jgi:peptidoglycan LD-endopeptidase LytH
MRPQSSLIFGSVLAAASGVWLLGADNLASALSAGAGADAVSSVGEPAGPDVARDGAGAKGSVSAPAPAALGALRTALAVEPPYQERARPGGWDGWALGYRVALRAGDTLRVSVGDPRLRLHAYRAGDAERAAPVPLAATRGDGVMELVAGENGEVTVLVHGDPGERASDDAFTVRVERSGGLVFPVAGRGPEDVISHFLEFRDGGRRLHHGVDIAALRGNPVRAVADGVIERIETTPLGGLTIRLVERRTGHVHYYAHLSGALVGTGDRVVAGQTIGGVGNTGNARNTPPHLHYGVFDGSAVLDPMKLLRSSPLDLAADTASVLLGTRARITVDGTAMRAAPARMGAATSLAHGQTVHVLAEADRYFRVKVGEREGYVARWVVEPE